MSKQVKALSQSWPNVQARRYPHRRTSILLTCLATYALCSAALLTLGTSTFDWSSRAQLILQATMRLTKKYRTLSARLATDPGLPFSNYTLPFWMVPPANITSNTEAIPEYADIVIIGSGITGTSFGYNAFALNSSLNIVMLEAREACSGATGRNGGHINPPLYHDYALLSSSYSPTDAQQLIRFRLSHVDELIAVADKEDILDWSQVRRTEHLDVYWDRALFTEAKEDLALWRSAMPREAAGFGETEGVAVSDKFHLSENTAGCIYNPGGAIHPYRFVTSLLSKLLSRYPTSFRLFTRTPALSITPPRYDALYTVMTPSGAIRTPHIIHATNGWSSHLLPGLRSKLVPVRGTMSAQRPGAATSASSHAGGRSWVFYFSGRGYDYLTQLPTYGHELMFGGGWASASGDGPAVGITDDGVVDEATAAYLGGALPQVFGLRNWGAEGVGEDEGDGWASGRMKAQWSGVLGISVDSLPWVGRLPEVITGRGQSATAARVRRGTVADDLTSGEWIAAGYTGEGMVHAWMSAKALAYMVLGREEEIASWFPEVLRVTERRWKEASGDKLIARLLT